jgi:hypothetical protein
MKIVTYNVNGALFRPEVRAAFHALVAQGWTDFILFGIISAMRTLGMPGYGLTISC